MRRPELLIVDDEPEILELLSSIFDDYQVKTATTADLALEALESHCDLLITDLKMPGKSGLDLIEAVKVKKLSLPIIVITGHRSELSKDQQDRVFRWINKPFRRQAIRDAVAEALAGRGRSKSTKDH